ncbi:cytochrome p450 [Fusarium mexicanum]|uniref:Cytochrome p450 n=1 Tax=Fusarium mexicanum TaxID=751941 RepID=A0A8H5N0A5_9HYPO|nr:cytochrome p450 [Fusarium mexicanum]
MTFGGKRWLFLNSRRAVSALLDKKAAIYSSLQNLPMAGEVISGNKRLLLMPYGAEWCKQRKAMHQILNNTKSTVFQPFQDLESRALLYHYIKKPDRWWEANARFANSIIMSVTYGKRSDLGNPDLSNLLNNVERFNPYLMPSQALVDIFPGLLKLPIPSSWQPWRWWGDALHQATKRGHKKVFDDLLERRKLGTQKPCFMTKFLDMNTDGEFSTEDCYFIGGTLIEAGSDTTRVTLMEILAAAVLYPDWVEGALQQLDSVCGSKAERLPDFGDMPKLTLIKAIVKESMRWKPAIGETGIPHSLIKDDTFDGYKIAAGTVAGECVLLYCFTVTGIPGETIDVSESFDATYGKAPFGVNIKPRSEGHRELIEPLPRYHRVPPPQPIIATGMASLSDADVAVILTTFERNVMKRQAPRESSEDSQPSRKRGLSSRPPRASQACRACAASKVRYDDFEECRRCIKRGIPCIRSSQVEQDHHGALVETPHALSDSSTGSTTGAGDSYALSSKTENAAGVPSLTTATTDVVGRGETHRFHQVVHDRYSDIRSTEIIVDTMPSDTTEWLRNSLLDAEFDTSFLPLPFLDVSGCFEDTSMQDPTKSTLTSSKGLPPKGKVDFEEAMVAYGTTLGSWNPSDEDYLATARASLYVPLDEHRHLGEDLGPFNPAVISGYLSSARRDEIIVAVIDGAQTAHSLPAIRMFPSTETLDKFLKIFLTTQETNASAFIHIATFDPSTCSLPLLIACIVAGAVSSSRTLTRKFGLGLFDMLRLYLAASMLRHAGLFAQHTYSDPTLMLDKLPSDSDEAWRRWAQQESLKRTVFRHLLQCTQRSVIRNVSAQMSPLDISTPIPEDCRFWFAKSATEWKSLYQNHEPRSAERRMTIIDCLSDIRSIELLSSFQASSLAKSSLLYSFLSLLVADHHRRTVFRKKEDSGWSFNDVTRSPVDSDMVSLFDELREVIEGDLGSEESPTLTFMVEFTMLYSAILQHLRESLLDSGKQTSASDIFFHLQEWQQSRSSRFPPDCCVPLPVMPLDLLGWN